MRGRVHFGEFGPGIFSGPNLQSAPRFCKVRRQSLRVRGGFLQSAHFAEKRGAGFAKSRVFEKCPPEFLNARVRRFKELSLISALGKGPLPF